MEKTNSTKRSTASGRFVTKSLGSSKAAKFSAVEGVRMSVSSQKVMTMNSRKGLKGDALRGSIYETYRSKKG